MKDPKGGLLIALGGPKKGPPMGDEEEEAGGDSFLRDAFDAIKSDDFESFKSAMTGWYESCMGE